jgi:hypothetical protein
MKIGQWLQQYPHLLERAYQGTHKLFHWLDPLVQRLGYGRFDRWLRPAEAVTKKAIFDCRMCGQCILHSTGMTCPMTCPKNLRNGPCGGVRTNGHCEVMPEMRCVWVEAYERSRHMPVFGGDILHIQPPVNRQLEGSSAWVNMLTGVDKDVPPGWVSTSHILVISEQWTVNSSPLI